MFRDVGVLRVLAISWSISIKFIHHHTSSSFKWWTSAKFPSSFSSTWNNNNNCRFSLILNTLQKKRKEGTSLNVKELCTVPSIMGKGGFYAVARGRKVGIFMTWDSCNAQVSGFSNPRYKKFESREEARRFIQENNGPPSSSASATTQGSFSNHGSSHLISSSNTNASQPLNVPTSRVPNPGCSRSLSSVPSLSSSGQGTIQNRVKRKAVMIDPISHPPTSQNSIMQIQREIHTTARNDKRALKVTEDRVTGVKRLKTEHNAGVDLSSFTVDDEGYVVVFTDGACTSNGKRGAKAGIGVWFGDSHELNISEPVIGRQTNNTAEILAAERAILQAKNTGVTKLKVMTDSQFTINCITKWIGNWKRNNWKLSSGQDVKNKEDLIKLDKALQGVQIKWSYVPGHRGHYGNERADQLAVAGANMRSNR